MDQATRSSTRTAPGDGPWLAMAQGLFRLPMAVFVYAVEMMATTLRGAYRLTDEGMARVIDPNRMAEDGRPGATEDRAPFERETDRRTERKEDREMADTNLADDQVKLVRYTVVFIKRDEEEVLEQDDVLITDNMTPEGFASWRIAHYFQQKDHKELEERDKKYLRVCYWVVCRWPREPLHYEKRQLDELEGIRKAIEAKK